MTSPDLFSTPPDAASSPAPAPASAPAKGNKEALAAQYQALKKLYPDFLLALRVGEFYEFLFEDAFEAAELASLRLTEKGQWQGKPVPQAGVPAGSFPQHLAKWVRKGKKLALCEQSENNAGGLMTRRPVRLYTPGTLIEEDLLDPEHSNYLAALGPALVKDGEEVFPLVWADISTGEFAARLAQANEIEAELARLNPAELLLPQNFPKTLAPESLRALSGHGLTLRPEGDFDPASGAQSLPNLLGKGFDANRIEAELPSEAFGAAGALAVYLRFTHLASGKHMPVLAQPQSQSTAVMGLDAATRRNLELLRNRAGGRQGTLLSVLDGCVSVLGKRLLSRRIAQPLADKAAIEARLDEVAFFINSANARKASRQLLAQLPDLPRILARLALARARAEDLPALASASKSLPRLARTLAPVKETDLPAGLDAAAKSIRALPVELMQKLERAAMPEEREDGLIRSGFDAILDEKRTELAEISRAMEALVQTWRREKNQPKLKMRHIGGLGHLLELPASAAKNLLNEEAFTLRQTLSNKIRLTHPELGRLDHQLYLARQAVQAREQEVLDLLASDVLEARPQFLAAASAVAVLDVSAALADLAVQANYVRPEFFADGRFQLEAARHPVLENVLARQGREFSANDCHLDAEGKVAPRLMFLTGPNMGGKSTFLRQAGLILCMAQMGSFVPAKAAKTGMVDRLFLRLGSDDNQISGRSTFMVEMMEMAEILRRASKNSFVLIDEIGRGTATHDGLALAQAVGEFLHDTVKCRAAFSTHFHELTRLAETLSAAANFSMQVRREGDYLRFLYKIAAGAAPRSLGLETARLAGLPQNVLARAEEIFTALEGSAGQTKQ